MSWLGDAFGGLSDTVGSAFTGITGAVTDIANSDAAKSALALAAQRLSDSEEAIQKATGTQTKQASSGYGALPSWAVPAGIGVAMLIVVFIMAKELK